MEVNDILTALFAIAFGCWAGVVAYIGAGIRTDIRTMASEMRQESVKLNEYIVQTESRLAVLESHSGVHVWPSKNG